MAGMFIGESVHKVDNKGRVSIPSEFRVVLQENDPAYDPARGARVVVNYAKHKQKNHLECYTIEAFQELSAKILALPAGSKQKRALQAIYLSKAHPAMVDETGRMVLPAKCRDPFGIAGEAVFMASGDTFKILTSEAYEAEMAAVDDYLETLDDDQHPESFLNALSDPGAVH